MNRVGQLSPVGKTPCGILRKAKWKRLESAGRPLGCGCLVLILTLLSLASHAVSSVCAGVCLSSWRSGYIPWGFVFKGMTGGKGVWSTMRGLTRLEGQGGWGGQRPFGFGVETRVGLTGGGDVETASVSVGERIIRGM